RKRGTALERIHPPGDGTGAIVYPLPEESIMTTFQWSPLQWIEDLGRDIAFGSRTLARTRGFTAVAVTTLALGIGAVTVIYSVVRNVVLDPFPYTRSERMVNVVLKDASNRIVRGPYFPAAE